MADPPLEQPTDGLVDVDINAPYVDPNARKLKPKRTFYQFYDDLARASNFGAVAKEQNWAPGQHAYTDVQDDDFYANEFEDNELNPAEALYKAPESEKNIELLNDNLNAHKKTWYSDLRYLSSYDKMHYLSAWNLAKNDQLKDGSPEELKKEILSLRAAILFLSSDMQKLATITDRLKQMNPYYVQAYLAGSAAKYGAHVAHHVAKKTGAYKLGRHIAEKTGADVLAEKARQKAAHYGAKAVEGAAHYGSRAAQAARDFGESASKTLKRNVAYAQQKYHNLPPVSTVKKSFWPFSGGREGKTRKRRARSTRRRR